MYHYRLLETGWGMVAYAALDNKVAKVILPTAPPGTSGTEEQKKTLMSELQAFARKRGRMLQPDPTLLPGLAKDLKAYFSGAHVEFHHDLDLDSLPPFTRKVLAATRKVPYGTTVSYKDLARQTGNSRACRAVGGAMAGNPVPLLVPCHRVIGSDGKLHGFSAACGVELKERMLRMEGAAPRKRRD